MIMVRSKYVAFVLYLVMVLVFWNVLDLLYVSFITRSVYAFSMGAGLMTPLISGIITGYLFIFKTD